MATAYEAALIIPGRVRYRGSHNFYWFTGTFHWTFQYQYSSIKSSTDTGSLVYAVVYPKEKKKVTLFDGLYMYS